MRSLTALISRRSLLAVAAFVAGAVALSDARPVAAQEPLKIGIIGTGKIGGALARHWVAAGHEVFMSSRHPEELAPLAAARGGAHDEAQGEEQRATRNRGRVHGVPQICSK